MKILLTGHEQSSFTKINSLLEKEGYLCEVARNFSSAHEKVNLYEYDCVLIDLNLPDVSGLQLLEFFKNSDRTDGVIILSGNAPLNIKLQAFESGADDFIIKPYDLAELLARINAVIRRKKFNAKRKLYFANLVIDFALKKVFVWDKVITLTKKEYEILLHLTANKNRVVSKDSLIEYLWGEQADTIDSFDFLFAHIKNLRKKLKEAKAEIEIKNIYKMGYQIIEL